MMKKVKLTLEFAGLLALMITVVYAAFSLALHLEEHTTVRTLVAEFGVLGMVAIGFIGGLNIAVPVHAATFTPIFLAAHFSIYTIILSLVVGTLLADLLSFQFGVWGKRSTRAHFPNFHKWLVTLKEKHHHLILPGVFAYAAFVPFPNETILIPLGLMGYNYWTLALPLFLGTLMNQALYSIGVASVFDLLL